MGAGFLESLDEAELAEAFLALAGLAAFLAAAFLALFTFAYLKLQGSFGRVGQAIRPQSAE